MHEPPTWRLIPLLLPATEMVTEVDPSVSASNTAVSPALARTPEPEVVPPQVKVLAVDAQLTVRVYVSTNALASATSTVTYCVVGSGPSREDRVTPTPVQPARSLMVKFSEEVNPV